jgi:hypothetical protein
MNKVHRFVNFLYSTWTFHEQQELVNISWTFQNNMNYFMNFMNYFMNFDYFSLLRNKD